MKFAWIENDIVRDIAPGIPAEFYHAEIAVLYSTEVPDEAARGDGWVNGALVKPAPVVPVEPATPAPVPPKVSPVEFMLLFTSMERVAIKALRPTNPVVDDFLDIIEDPRLTYVDLGLGSISEALDYMIALGIITAERKVEIVAGTIQ